MNKNVIVTDEYGTQIGVTYPKRAKGLVRHGRAVYTGEYEIRLTGSCPSAITEDKSMHTLYIKPRSFHAVKDCEDNVFSRTFMSGFLDGRLQESLMLGDWQWNWSEAASEPLELQPNSDYVVTFWLNGGENDQYNETCDFRILFTDDPAQEVDRQSELIYKLNRKYIKPVKSVDGWELYEIPFRTEEKQYTFLKFVAMRAPMAVLPAGDVSDYADLTDRPHPLAEGKKQRPNIVFDSGYPEGYTDPQNETGMYQTLTDTLCAAITNAACTPYADSTLRELKDMLNMLLSKE